MNILDNRALKILGRYVLISILAIIWLYPLIIVISTSVRTQMDIVCRGVFKLPAKIIFDNFSKAWELGNFSIFYKNSVIISFIKVPIGIFVSALAAYPLAKWNFKLRDGIFYFFILGFGIPVTVTLLPLTILLNKIHLLNTLWSLLFPYIAFGLPFQILTCRGFFRTIPDELIEAARIDGCGEISIFSKIILPLSRPALAALFIIDFVATWNEFPMALIFIHDDRWKTIPLGIMYFQGQFSSSYGVINAGVALSILPVLFVYILLQRYFVEGTAGALKG